MGGKLYLKEELYELIVKSEFVIPKHIKTIIIILYADNNNKHPLVVNGKSIIPDHIETVIFPRYFPGHSLYIDGIKVLPDGIKCVNFGMYFDKPMVVDGERLLPESLESITFSTDYNQPLRINGINAIPSNVHTIEFGTRFDQDLVVDGVSVLPKNLKTIYFGKKFNRPLLYLDKFDNERIIRAIPDGVRYVDFRRNEYYNDRNCSFFSFIEFEGNILSQFNQPVILNNVSAFPKSVEYVYFGSSFNHPLLVNNIYALPDTLKKLCINGLYDYYIPLSNSIEYLALSEDALHIQIHSYLSDEDISMIKYIPRKMVIEIIQSNTDIPFFYKIVPIDECIRRQNNINNYMTIMNNIFGGENIDWKLYIHPMGCYKKFETLPYSYELFCSSFENKKVDRHSMMYGIPDGVKTVNFVPGHLDLLKINTHDNTMEYDKEKNNFTQKKKKRSPNNENFTRIIPNSVRNINYYHSYAIVNGLRVLPDNIENITFDKDYNYPILDGSVSAFPDNIKRVILRHQFNKPIIEYPFRAFPNGIKYIRFGYWFNQIIIDGCMSAIPNGTEIVKFGHQFNKRIIIEDVSAFSDGIQEIYFSSKFNRPIINGTKVAFPDSVKKLVFPPKFDQKIFENDVNGIPSKLESIEINAEYIRQYDHFPETLKEFKLIPQYCRDSLPKSLPSYDAINEFRHLKLLRDTMYRPLAEECAAQIIDDLFKKIGHVYKKERFSKK